MSTTSIFDTLAQQDTQKMQHDQSLAAPVSPAAQPSNIFDQLAANEGNLHKMQTGPTISAQPSSKDFDPDLNPDPFLRAGLKIGAPFARKMMDAVDKLREIENFTQEGRQEHPIQAHLGDIANRLEGFLFGNEQHPEHAIGTGKYGMANNPALALVSAAPGAAEAAGAVEGGIRGIRAAGEAGEEAPGIIKQVLKGKGVAQEPAKAAIRTAAGAEEEAPLQIKGSKNILDEPIKAISEKERAAYKAQDEAAGFDVKETRAKLKDAEYKVKQPEIDEATKQRLDQTIADSKHNIELAEKKMSEAGVDPKAADNIFKQRKAGEDFRKALVTHVSADGESVNVDGLLNAAKKLRNSPKGDRLEQFLGSKERADQFVDSLLKAQEAGAHAVKMRWLAGTIGTALGATGEAARIVKTLAAPR